MELNDLVLVLLMQEEISSPLTAQIMEFCESGLFPETLQNSEVVSTSNAYYDDHSSYTRNLSYTTPEVNKSCSSIVNNESIKTPKPLPPNTCSNLSMIFASAEDLDKNVSGSTDFFSTPFSVPNFEDGQQEQFDLSLLQKNVGVTEYGFEPALYQNAPDPAVPPPLIGPPLGPLPSLHVENCLSSLPSYMPMNSLSSPSCSVLDPEFLSGNLNSALPNRKPEKFRGNLFLNNNLQLQEQDDEVEMGGIFGADPLPQLYNTDLQNNIVDGSVNFTPLPTEITSLEDPAYKASKLSAEEKKEKIHRYLKKRNERNFSKKIKYACRKSLADSRLRIRGRFVRNGNFGDGSRTTCSSHEEDTYNDVMVKDEDDMVDSSDIFAQVSNVNTYTCNYSTIESWI
ncbi:uncharacterized protein LOC141661978 [Apium graveolens]|uniref:uncharacterized protein LOC141661978 n=1 Tax=Apium graveolens TaxID=4045 RepID=UPI003D7BC335